MYNDENMLMTDLELVDEQDYEEAMQAAYDAMCEPEIIISDNASPEQERLVNDINWLLNGCEHTLEKPLKLASKVDTIMCEKVVYQNKELYAERYDMAGDYWERMLLETVISDDLEMLYGQLINEKF